ncbi:hypothetical protein Naga_100109g10 [Nannochloropsis gaditana]|uniref:Uncharacterized protein n=1 Tax=Nannochloropsis gaditana TaxID=72520 RepID=W7TQI7_9STRA|nr:hypothetical protein Naga_100109g10 [Nannochloropsis gaditana]
MRVMPSLLGQPSIAGVSPRQLHAGRRILVLVYAHTSHVTWVHLLPFKRFAHGHRLPQIRAFERKVLN